MSRYYDRSGDPISLDEWVTTFKPDRQKVANRTLNDPEGREHYVSTVWLGLDHSWNDGPPLIFETMIFCHGHECQLNNEQWRYSTEAEAEQGHQRAVELVEAGVPA